MGVVNVTPDSFSDGGNFLDPVEATDHALRLLGEGADIIDIGGESTRPGTRILPDKTGLKQPVSAAEELERVMPVIESLHKERPDAVISIDTYKADVARAAIAAGADIVNDVSALQWDAKMAGACAELQCGVILMHTRGRPQEWHELGPVENITALVEHDLANRLQVAFEMEIERDRIVLDPGFGFGKNFAENYSLLAHFGDLHRMGFPLMAGTSRKSFLGRTVRERTGRELPAAGRLNSSLAATVASILAGAHIVRVHDVTPAVEAAAIADAILAARGA